MATRVYESLWANQVNRTFIFSVLLTFWRLIIELYLIFWRIETIEKHILLGVLYTDVNLGFIKLVSPFLDLFHIIIWSSCFFFSWMSYTLAKTEFTNSNPA